MATKLLQDGVWTWFNHPVAVASGSDLIIGAWPQSQQKPLVAKYDTASKKQVAVNTATVNLTYETDDHDNPAMLVLASGKVLVGWSEHNHAGSGDAVSRTSTANGDTRNFGASVTMLASSNQSYVQFLQASDTSETVYRFFRIVSSGSTGPQYFQTSTDDGATWSGNTQFAEQSGERPYFRFWQTSGTRFDFACTQGVPELELSDGGIYHGYMTIASDGTREYFTTAGVSIGDDSDLPLAVTTDLTEVYDGATNQAWIWDLKVYSGPTPVVVFAVFTDVDVEVHEYWRGKWNGSSWDTEKICDAGTTSHPDWIVESGGETVYSGGVCLDPLDEDIVYASVEYGDNDWRMEKWERDGGGTWSKTADLSGDTNSKNCRPVAVAVNGVTQVLWWEGTYNTWTDYDTSIWVYPSASFRTAKPASPELDTDYTPSGLQAFVPMQEGTGAAADLTGNHTVSQAGTVTWTSTAFGYKTSGFSTSNHFTIDSLAGAWDDATYPRWFALLLENSSTTGDVFPFGLGRSSSNNPLGGLALNIGGVAGTVHYLLRNDSTTTVSATATGLACNDGNKHVAMCVSYSASDHRLYWDGAQVGTSTGNLGTITLDRATLGCLRRSTASSAYGGALYAFAAGWGAYVPNPEDFAQDWLTGRFSGLADTAGVAIPILAYHYNHHLGSMG